MCTHILGVEESSSIGALAEQQLDKLFMAFK